MGINLKEKISYFIFELIRRLYKLNYFINGYRKLSNKKPEKDKKCKILFHNDTEEIPINAIWNGYEFEYGNKIFTSSESILWRYK